MNLKSTRCGSLALLALLACMNGARATDKWIISSAGETDAQGATPGYAVLQRKQPLSRTRRAVALPPTWVYSYQDGKFSFNDTFIGTAVGSNTSTTVPVYIIPVALVSGTIVADPTTTIANGVSVIQNVVNSPLFQSSVDYVQEHIDLGTTQYEDAVVRASLFAAGAIQPGQHVLLGTPAIEPVQTITLDSTDGTVVTMNKQPTILANEQVVDTQLTAMIAALGIPSNALPVFVLTTSYLTNGAPATGTCCIGGYHSLTTAGGQPYVVATYITAKKAFGENIAALSSVLGGWLFDPYTSNTVPKKCGTGALLEVGTPLQTSATHGVHAYTVNGVTWDPQDLALVTYFGAPSWVSVNSWRTFQGKTIGVCAKGG